MKQRSARRALLATRRRHSLFQKVVTAMATVAMILTLTGTASAAYYVQSGTCSGTYSNWRGDYTTGYDWFGKTYSSDVPDCDAGFVDIYNSGVWQAGDSDTSGTINAVASSSYATHTRHQLCWDWIDNGCHTGHWLEV